MGRYISGHIGVAKIEVNSLDFEDYFKASFNEAPKVLHAKRISAHTSRLLPKRQFDRTYMESRTRLLELTPYGEPNPSYTGGGNKEISYAIFNK